MNSVIKYRPLVIRISSEFFEAFLQDVFEAIMLGVMSPSAITAQSCKFLIYQWEKGKEQQERSSGGLSMAAFHLGYRDPTGQKWTISESHTLQDLGFPGDLYCCRTQPPALIQHWVTPQAPSQSGAPTDARFCCCMLKQKEKGFGTNVVWGSLPLHHPVY